ncbi:dTDP-4-dehydrorhamnose 3,5-epimerase family protein [Sphingomonas sp.]|uniref:dTDP-4-dehydrorhamnose 3,5-epimerase family protein n=1 Tax=Sphingomonas sp. TaxID=28214 RepID=UPI0035BBA2A4
MSNAVFPLLEGEAPRIEDARGWLQVLYETPNTVLKRSFSRAGVFRGLHAQAAPSPQTKIIRVASGRIIDFLVSLDDSARTLHHREIGPGDGWIRVAARYAHGFYALEDTIFEYVCDGGYDESSEQAFSILDSLRDMGIVNPILSDKDCGAPALRAVIV